MRTFKSFNPNGEPCPMCKTKKDAETVLIPDFWGRLVIGKATQIHRECYDLWRKMNDLEPEEYES